MAEIVASAVLKAVFQKLTDEALKQFVRSHGIHSELKNLNKTLSKIQKLLTDASEKENGDKDVKDWLNSLHHLAYDIDDILDRLATDAMHRELNGEPGATASKVRKLVPTCCTNFSLSNRYSHKLDSIATKLQDLENEKVSLGLTVKDERPTNMSRRNETSLPDASCIVGRHDDKEKLLQKLLNPCDKNFGVIPIVGMGGVGKTTLARLLYNETRVKDHFELMAWVCVSDNFDIFKISKTIFQCVTRETGEFEDLNQLQMALIEKLKEKRILLVLDDVWSENYYDWENLVRPFHSWAIGSKIIVTTRKERLLQMMGFDHLDHLKSLSHGEALSLFSQHALGVDNFESHETLKIQGEGIVKKCGGLPLALKVLGRLLRTKKEEEEWNEVLNSEIWGLEDVDGEIIPALRLSYHELPACLKQLFAYCSLFPKNFMFDKDDLVLLWMAEGFLNRSSGSLSPERLGHKYFEKLLSRSFFQHAPNDESLFVMHDLINDLATFVAGDLFLRFDNQIEMENETLAKYRHLSFIREKYVAYPKFEEFKRAKCLRTFLAVSIGVTRSFDFYLSYKILVDLLPELALLRVLSLSSFEISEVPESIGSLKHLRYLNLSLTKITYLPENVGNLYNLQTLIVFGCRRLTKLPTSFLKLKNLRHFDIRDTQLLNKIPLGIVELKSLQTITKIIIGRDYGFAITDLKDLKNLRGKISIKGLEKVENAMHARVANFSLKRISELEVEWGDEFDGSRNETLEKEVLDLLMPHNDSLKKLEIVSYRGTEFPNWVGAPSFLRLVHVTLRGCKSCTSLPALGQLPLLKELFIQGMDEVKVVDSELLGTGVAFLSLEILSFEDMCVWEVWSTNSGGACIVFPSLLELRVKKCPKLIDVSLEAIPLLRILKVGNCGHGVLRSLVHVASSVTILDISYIYGLTDEVWRGVIEYLGTVEEVRIQDCEEIRYLWESEAHASKVLANVRKLQVWGCDNLVRLGEKEENNCGSGLLTSFRRLDVSLCKSMEHCTCPSSVENLIIYICCSIKTVSFPTTVGGVHNLKTLSVYNCKELMENELGGEKINKRYMPMLECVRIHCWPNMKSMIELTYFIHLVELVVQDCPSLKSFHDIQMPKLTSLIHLEIKNCPGIDASFPRGLWPPKLCTLVIGGLKKPISKWGSQDFPTSLVNLTLYGEHISDFSQLPDLLPPSLTSLDIKGFKKLETLLMGLQHLTSLEHLSIYDCPKMMHLPEMLLPSLLSLRIYGCPNLKERCSRSGKGSYYWPLISHIPCIDTQGYIFELIPRF